jgi:hypothetical protein
MALSSVALIASLTSLWKSVLKPARIAIDPIDHKVFGRSDGHDVPSIYSMSVDLAISNEGARAGVLTRIDFANVESVGWPEFAKATIESDYWLPTIADAGDGKALGLPSTLAPGGIETVRINFKLQGAVYEAARTTPQPNLTPLAVGLFNLREVRLEARVQYRRASPTSVMAGSWTPAS